MQFSKAKQFLINALPTSDRISISDDLVDKFISHSLMLLNTIPWCKDIPEDIFLSYVLFPRVNNEHLQQHRQTLFSALYPIVENLTMEQAAIEANFWCLQKATYCTTDERTANANTVIKAACGRCGEESTLLVCTLRSIGIPARQIYVPRWAHCDDNHAWVEAYIDNAWHYMGACEPEPVLDNGWFTSAASRAMLIQTVCYGLAPKNEEILSEVDNHYIVNRTSLYAQTKNISIKVFDNGIPLAFAQIGFELFNEGELIRLATIKTNCNGQAYITLGLGGIHLHISYGKTFITTVIDTRLSSEFNIDFSAKQNLISKHTFQLHAPIETKMAQLFDSNEYINKLEICNNIRRKHENTFCTENIYLKKAKDNAPVLKDFLNNTTYSENIKTAMLSTLTDKDFLDITSEVLLDSIEICEKFENNYTKDIFTKYILSCRVENEHLYPVRKLIFEYFQKIGILFNNINEIFDWVNSNINCNDLSAIDAVVAANPYFALLEHNTDLRTIKILTITICRIYGFACRLCPITNEIEYYCQGKFIKAHSQKEPTASLLITNPHGLIAKQHFHFTLSKLNGLHYETVHLPANTTTNEKTILLQHGNYRLVTGTRQIDGSTVVQIDNFELQNGQKLAKKLYLPENNVKDKLHCVTVPSFMASDLNGNNFSPLSRLSNGGIIALISPNQEPTEHLLLETKALQDRLYIDNRNIVFLVMNSPSLDIAQLKAISSSYKNNVDVAILHDTSIIQFLRKNLHTGDPRLPFEVAITANGNALFAFANYQISAMETLLDILNS